MNMNFIKVLLLVMLATMVRTVSAESLLYQDWQQAKTAATVIKLPAVRNAVNAVQADPERHMVLHHPGNDAGQHWAETLRAQLVSLGLDSRFVKLRPHNGDVRVLDIRVE